MVQLDSNLTLVHVSLAETRFVSTVSKLTSRLRVHERVPGNLRMADNTCEACQII